MPKTTKNTRQNTMSVKPLIVKSPFRKALPQILAVGVKNVLLLSFGMTLGYPTFLIPSLSGSNPNEKISLDEEALSWVGSINLICVPVGCFLSGFITQPLGRKRSMQLVNLPFLLAWMIFYFSTEVWHVFLALCLTGLAGGLLEAPTLTYIAEITTPDLRGILSSCTTIAVITGVLFEYLLGTFLNWRTVALVSSAAPIVGFLLLFFIPESPHWLIYKGRMHEAQSSIAWLNGWAEPFEVEQQFKELCTKIDSSKTLPQNKLSSRWNRIKTSTTLYCQKKFIWPFALVSWTFFLCHFCGMAVLQTFAVTIFNSFKSPVDGSYATIFLGVAQVLGCILSASLVHFVGKRRMNFVSLLGTGVCFIAVATYGYSIGVTRLETSPTAIDTSETTSWLPMTFLIGAALFSYMGIRVLPWMLTGEVYSNETRALGSGFSSAVSYFLNFAANKSFYSTVESITLPGAFWMYGGISLGGFGVLYFALPETEGKTLWDVMEHFSGEGKLSNEVGRKEKKDGREVLGRVNVGFEVENEKNLESRL